MAAHTAVSPPAHRFIVTEASLLFASSAALSPYQQAQAAGDEGQWYMPMQLEAPLGGLWPPSQCNMFDIWSNCHPILPIEPLPFSFVVSSPVVEFNAAGLERREHADSIPSTHHASNRTEKHDEAKSKKGHRHSKSARTASSQVMTVAAKHRSHSDGGDHSTGDARRGRRRGGMGALFPLPTPTGVVQVKSTITVASSLDGRGKEYDSTPMGGGGQDERQPPVFSVADGGSLSNLIISGPGADGVHCHGSCDINNVWFKNVGEDAITFKGNRSNIVGNITGGGARGAKDKVVQFNSGGKVTIRNYHVDGFGKLARSCGNSAVQHQRHFVLDGITASGGTHSLVGINSDMGDTAHISNVHLTGKQVPLCVGYHSVPKGHEPAHATGPGPGCNVQGGPGGRLGAPSHRRAG